jgi:lipoate-protein ligase A
MSHPPWRLIRSGFMTGAENMALDEALLEAVAGGRSGPVLRLYRWNPPTVTLGYAQRGEDLVNLAACRELGFDVVRRCTGGRAVLHDREVTYAVIAPERDTLFPGGILENYKVIAEALRQTLDSLGLPAVMAPGRCHGAEGVGVQKSACFTAPSSYELVHQGCKVTGGAQKRHGGAFLQHGSIPVELDLERLFCALDTRREIPACEGARLLGQSIGWLNRWLPAPVSVSAVEDRLVATVAESWGIRLAKDAPSAAERKRAAALLAEKYANRQWNLKGIGREDRRFERAGK